MALTRLENFIEAQQQFSALLARHPRHDLAAVTFIKLGGVQAAARNYTNSAQTFSAFLKRFPKHERRYLAQFGVGFAMENLKKHDEARQWYQKVIAWHNGETAARAQFQIGECYFAQGKLDLAVKELLKVDIIYAYPEWSSRALYEAGVVFQQLKQVDQARTQWELCVKKYKDTGPAALAQKRLKALGAGG